MNKTKSSLSEEEIREYEVGFLFAEIGSNFRTRIDRLFAGYCSKQYPLPDLIKHARRAYKDAKELELKKMDSTSYDIIERMANVDGDPFQQFNDHPWMRFYKLHSAEKQYFEDRRRQKRLKEATRIIEGIFAAKPL